MTYVIFRAPGDRIRAGRMWAWRLLTVTVVGDRTYAGIGAVVGP
ncbi:hypothetical protein [Streptomyces deserti]